MICGRPEATFSKLTEGEDLTIEISIEIDNELASSGRIHLTELISFDDVPEPSHIRIKCDSDVLEIFLGNELGFITSPDDLLMRRGRFESFISGFDNYRDLLTFDLLYVGIAKETQDSYSRLIEKGHKARMDILASEQQRSTGARVSDETYLLLFRVEPLITKMFGGSKDLDDEDFDCAYDYHRIVADAEKALINAFKPHYNRQLYVNYPRGSDGLYKEGYDAYSYSIAEGFAFNTAYGTIKGARSSEHLLLSNEADFILVSDDEVSLNISGQDFYVSEDQTTSNN